MYVLLPVDGAEHQFKQKGNVGRTYTQLCGVTGVEPFHGALDQRRVHTERLGDIYGEIRNRMLMMGLQRRRVPVWD